MEKKKGPANYRASLFSATLSYLFSFVIPKLR
jgi:hypothetical protein